MLHHLLHPTREEQSYTCQCVSPYFFNCTVQNSSNTSCIDIWGVTLTDSSTDCAKTSTAMPRLKKGCWVMSYILARKPPFSVRQTTNQRLAQWKKISGVRMGLQGEIKSVANLNVWNGPGNWFLHRKPADVWICGNTRNCPGDGTHRLLGSYYQCGMM